MKISVILPVYNEAENLKELLPNLIKILQDHWPDAYEIIAVNDGSTDQSWSVLKKMGTVNASL